MNEPAPDILSTPPAHRQNQLIFNIYNIYRLLLSLILVVSFLFGPAGSILGSHDSSLYLNVSVTYVFLNLVVFLRAILPENPALAWRQYVAVIIIDILMLTLISYTCGGVTSGMAHLLIFPIAAGSILVQGRLSIFLASIGTIAAIYSEVYLYFTTNAANDYYVQAGLLGITLFSISLVIQVLGRRLRQNELIAAQQAANIAALQVMNHNIIQRMRTGILVVDRAGTVLNINGSARKLIQAGGHARNAVPLPAALRQQMQAWLNDKTHRAPPFRMSRGGPQIQASFSYLSQDSEADILIFLEDYSLLTSRIQQLKLLSLGRLTASIAHEVRNPLGAISHAGQLLNESDSIAEEDQRLVEIIINHSRRVNAIVENILQLSRNRVEPPGLIELKPWLEQFIVRLSNSYADGVSITLKIAPEDIKLRFNASQLEQLMINLCDNGIRYSTKKTGNPSLSIRAATDPAGQAPYMDIVDDGEGISKDNEEIMFEPFFTTESTGTGLGLYICREICEANQAQINFRWTEDEKSSFRINFAHPDRILS
ncbi:MAG: ATP-binding protein [Pseudomonadales bacterium]|nr:ATP-binding protein [Pseudomonadales bacterium]